MLQTTPPLTHLNAAEMAAAVHENLYALFRAMAALPGGELRETAQVCYHHVSPPNAMFKGVWRARLAAEDVDGAVDAAAAWFTQRGAPYFFWWTDAQSQPPDLAERLLERGFDGDAAGDPGMTADLHALNEDIHPPEGFTIRTAGDAGTLADWRDVFAASFGEPLAAGQAWIDAAAAARLDNPPWTMYTGCLDGRPAACSLLFLGAGVAGIYAVGTLPEYRRRGLGAAVTLRPLLDARALGYHYAVLFASRAGYAVYRRLGFQDVHNPIGIYDYEV